MIKIRIMRLVSFGIVAMIWGNVQNLLNESNVSDNMNAVLTSWLVMWSIFAYLTLEEIIDKTFPDTKDV